jgi:putative NADH-flavin reductase
MREHYPETTADKQLEYQLLTSSDVDWTLMSPPDSFKEKASSY